jgi:L-malate glycosyltransferase
MKKIIFVHLLNDFSGSPKVLSQTISTCNENSKFEAVLFTGKSEDGFLTNVTENHHFYFYKRFENKIGTLFTFVLSQIHLFFKLLKYRKQDVVIYVNTLLPFGAALAGKILDKPVYYHVHETSVQPLMLKRFLRFIAQKTALKIIFVSKSLKEAESFKNIEQEVVYNVLPSEFSNKALESQYQSVDEKEKFNVLMICSLKAYKGVGEFIKIAKLCEINTNINFTLILNAEQKDIDKYVTGFELPTNMNILDKQKDLHVYYQKASLVLNLSRIDKWVETFGLTILEAMSYGIPVIVPPIGGPTEIATDGVEGYLISSYEVDRISNKIKELSLDIEKCIELSKKAKKRSKVFNEETFKKEILKVLNE